MGLVAGKDYTGIAQAERSWRKRGDLTEDENSREWPLGDAMGKVLAAQSGKPEFKIQGPTQRWDRDSVLVIPVLGHGGWGELEQGQEDPEDF